MSFRSISKCCFYDSFSHCCHCYLSFCCCLFLWHMITFCQWMQNSQSGIFKQYSENISHGSMGLQLAWQVVPPRRVFLHLPTSNIYVSAVKLCWCVCQKRKDLLFYFTCRCSLTKKTWPQRASPTVNVWRLCSVYTCCWWRENYCWCESIPKWLTAHTCVCTVHFCNWDVM